MTETIEINNAKVRRALKAAYVERVSKNPKYSLRAFASFLGVDQSYLSKVLGGRRAPSKALIKRVEERIGQVSVAPNPGDVYTQMQEDHFSIISEWYHFALLELLKTKKYSSSIKEAAKLLNVSPMVVALAFERLKKLGYINFKNGKWVLLKPSNSWLNESKSSSARRQLQKCLLEKALRAIDEVPFERRDNSSITMACDPVLIPQIRTRITEFRRSLDAFIEQNGNVKQVYNLSIAFFPLSGEEHT